jgi:hypothetical protein
MRKLTQAKLNRLKRSLSSAVNVEGATTTAYEKKNRRSSHTLKNLRMARKQRVIATNRVVKYTDRLKEQGKIDD